MSSALKRDFYSQDTLTVARNLLGKKLIRTLRGKRLSGIITETEAYLGASDSASHAFRGQTPRNQVMFGPAGQAYVYFVYGMHYLLNVTTEQEGIPCAVLIRALKPMEGIKQMERYRGCKGSNLTNGPAKLCQALNIDKAFNQWDLTKGKKLWLEDYETVADQQICTGARIGIDYAATQDRHAPWRFWILPEAH